MPHRICGDTCDIHAVTAVGKRTKAAKATAKIHAITAATKKQPRQQLKRVIIARMGLNPAAREGEVGESETLLT